MTVHEAETFATDTTDTRDSGKTTRLENIYNAMGSLLLYCGRLNDHQAPDRYNERLSSLSNNLELGWSFVSRTYLGDLQADPLQGAVEIQGCAQTGYATMCVFLRNRGESE